MKIGILPLETHNWLKLLELITRLSVQTWLAGIQLSW